MRRLLILPTAASLILSACAGNRANSEVKGAAFGTAVGAAAGVLIGGGVTGGLIGATAGATVGATVGAVAAKRAPRQYYRDIRGYCYFVDSKGRTVYDAKAHC